MDIEAEGGGAGGGGGEAGVLHVAAVLVDGSTRGAEHKDAADAKSKEKECLKIYRNFRFKECFLTVLIITLLHSCPGSFLRCPSTQCW